MKSLLIALSAALFVGTCLSAPARAAQLDDVLKRLEALEQENSALRNRVRRLEARKTEPRDAQPAAVSPRAVVAAAPATAAYNAVPAYKAPPIVPPPSFSWSGVYVGGHVGGGFGTATVDDPFAVSVNGNSQIGAPIRDIHTSGFMAGAQIGANYQIAQLVVGAELSASWADVSGRRTDRLSVDGIISPVFPFPSNDTESRTWGVRTDWLATAAMRAGYAWDRWLVYAKGGIAAARNKYEFLGTDAVTALPAINLVETAGATGADTRIGWLVGAGVEWAVWNNWSVAIEYNYIDFGNEPVAMSGQDTVARTPPLSIANSPLLFATGIEQRMQTVKLGVNYRFGSAND